MSRNLSVNGTDGPANPAPAAVRSGIDPNIIVLAIALALLTGVPVVPNVLQTGTVVCAGLLPFLLKDVARDLRVRLLAITLVVWSVGQVLSDQVNGLGLEISRPAILAITILATTTTLVYFARGSFQNIRCLTLGIALGLIFFFLIFERDSIRDPETWKFELNVPVSISLLALTDLLWRKGHRLPSFVVLAVICGLGLWSDHRGFTGFAALTAVLILIPRGSRYRDPKTILAAGGTALLLGALGIVFVYSAQSGLLGQRSASQVRLFGSNPVSLLVNIRPELYQELSLFLQRPITGFGSQPHLSTSAYQKSIEFVQGAGVTNIESLNDYWLHLDIPGVSSHSMAADSWARAGVAAIPFWILLVVLALWAGMTTLLSRSSPLLIMWTMLVLWDTLFSPLPVTASINLAAYLAIALVTIASGTHESPPPLQSHSGHTAPVYKST